VSDTSLVLWLYGDIYCPWTRELLARIREVQAEQGTALRLGWRPLPLRPESGTALRAVEFARDLGESLADRVLDGLSSAAALDAVDPEDPATVLEACERLGLDREGVRHAVSDGRYDAELARAEQEAELYGIDTIPTLLIGSRMIVGAAPAELLKTEIDAVLSSSAADRDGE
jgi:predicted DsbA family dithiol-disulfide isomerase